MRRLDNAGKRPSNTASGLFLRFACTLNLLWLTIGVASASPAETGETRVAPTVNTSVTGRLPNRDHLGTWVWQLSDVIDAEQRRALLAFARSRGVRMLYLHTAPEYEQGSGLSALLNLVTQARQSAIEVMWVAGDPHWCLPKHHAQSVRVLERITRLNQLLAARGSAPIVGVAFDIEPYLLSEWHHDHVYLVEQYLQLLDQLWASCQKAGLETWHTIPFWFSRRLHARRTLDSLVMSRSNGVIVMAYRDRISDVKEVAEASLRRGEELGCPVVLALETKCAEPERTTFCGATLTELGLAIAELRRSLLPFPAFAGLAVHHYGSWRTLSPHFNTKEGH